MLNVRYIKLIKSGALLKIFFIPTLRRIEYNINLEV